MKNIKLFMKNFLSVGKSGAEINFEHGKIMVITGKIGSGKSTIEDAFHVLLFGSTYSKKSINNIINRRNKRNCELKLSFDLNGKHYEIERKYKPDSQSFKLNEVEQAYTGKTGFNDLIEKTLFLDKKILDHVNFLSQRFYTPFMEMKTAEKRDFIKRIFGLEQYDDMSVKVKKEISQLQIELSNTQGKIDTLEKQEEATREFIANEEKEKQREIEELTKEFDFKKTELSELEKQKKEVDIEEKERLEKTVKEKEENLIKLNESLRQKKENKDKHEKSIKRKKEIEERIKLLKSKYKEVSQDEIEQLKNEIDEMKVKGIHLATEIKQSENDIKEHEKKIKEKEAYEKQLKGYQGQRNKLKSELQNYEEESTLKEKIAKIEPIIENLSDKIEEKKKVLYSISTAPEENKIKFYETNTVCQECESELTDEYRSNKTEELQNIISEKKEKKNLINKEIEKLTKSKHDGQSKKGDLENKINERIIIFNDIEKIDNYIENVQNYINNISSIDIDLARKDIEKSKKEMKSLHITATGKKEDLKEKENNLKIKSDIQYLQREQEALRTIDPISEEYIKETEDKIPVIKEELRKIKEVLFQLEELVAHNKDIEKSKKEINYQVKNIQSNIERYKSKKINTTQLDTIIKEKSDIIKENKTKIKRKKLLDKLVIVVSDNGIKKYIVRKYVALLNHLSKKYLKKFGSRFTLIFSEEKGLDAQLVERAVDVDYWNLSNGESQQVNLANIFTFAEFDKLKNSRTFPMMFLDEMFDNNMDPDALKDVLSSLKDQVPYVSIISHREPVSTIADILVEVDKNNGKFSNYTVTRR